MVIIGAAHGLIFLPVMLSYFGKSCDMSCDLFDHTHFVIGPPYVKVECRQPYSKDPSERRDPPPVPVSSGVSYLISRCGLFYNFAFRTL